MNDATILFIPIPTFFSSSRINWWKLWLSMDCLSIWQAGHYLANGNIVIIPKWAIMLDQLYEAATSVSWKAKFCVNLYRGWTPSSFFDHQISSLEWCSVMAFKNASARFGSYHTRIQQLSAKNQSLKMLQFRKLKYYHSAWKITENVSYNLLQPLPTAVATTKKI